MNHDRLVSQMQFILEIDRLKTVLRQTLLMDSSRQENSAEHTWHLAVMAVLLAEYANSPIDLRRVLTMLLIHDIIEIDAGDTFAYDDKGNLDKHERETLAAERLFGLLPTDQATELRAAWDEFEEQVTPEARFANAMDRLQPLLHNYHTGGAAWRKHGVTADRVMVRAGQVAQGSEELFEYARALVEDAVSKGYLAPAPAK
jgi:putative hydrolase of HD superfamily